MFEIGSFWFWVLIIISFILLVWLTETEKPVLALVTVIGTLLLLENYGNLELVNWVSSQPGTVVVYILSWLVIGAFWSFISWWFFTRRARKKYEGIKAKFLQQNNVKGSSIPEGLKKEWREHLALSYTYMSLSEIIPKAGAYKKRIITSIIYWPWSFVWGGFFRHIWSLIQALLEGISSSAFKGVDSELLEDEPKS